MAARWWLIAVLLVSLAGLGYQIHKVGLASGFVDTVGRVRAQDEAVYAHSAIRMAREGDWLTPKFLGRYALYKPPLLYWLSGVSAKLLGVSAFSLRLPSLLAGTLVCVLVFAWLRKSHSLAAAVAAVILLLSNQLWHVLSRLCLTDVLLALWTVAALFCLSRDPTLAGRPSSWGVGIFSAAAILTKGIAGTLPLFILLVYSVLAPREQRPPGRRIAQVWLLAVLLALPWHLYQLAVHPRWFWAEYVQVEILTFGTGSPYQTSAENHVSFYLRRLLLADPVLCLLATAAAPWAAVAWRQRKSPLAALLVSWLAVLAAALLLFQYRNAAYLMTWVPALAILATAYGPVFGVRRAAMVTGALGLLFVAKAQFPDRPWGLSFQTGTTVQAAPLLDAYARLGRPNDLVLVSPDDEFYSAVLPLPRVRYCFIEPGDTPHPQLLDFRYLGINVTAGQFDELRKWRGVFLQRLRAWGLDSEEPIATVIVARSMEELVKTVLAHPNTDFFLPEALRSAIDPRAGATHRIVRASPEKFFLLGNSGTGDEFGRRNSSPVPELR